MKNHSKRLEKLERQAPYVAPAPVESDWPLIINTADFQDRDPIIRAAKRKGARSLTFVSRAGQIEVIRLADPALKGHLAICFERGEPTEKQQYAILLSLGLREPGDFTDCDTKIGGYSWHDCLAKGSTCRRCGEVVLG